MRRAVVAACFAATVIATAYSMPDSAKLAGLYCGTAFSGGHLVEVRTRLELGSDGLLQGTYDFADDGQTTSGTLQENVAASGPARSLTWFDKYGTGPVIMIFDETGMSFSGLWNAASFEPAFQWDGKRCEDEAV